jgi:hypothetical protein
MSIGTPNPSATCPATLADDINNGSFTTALPSPVAITPSASPAAGLVCGAPPILGGPLATYASSIQVINYIAATQPTVTIAIPEAALPTSGDFSIGCITFNAQDSHQVTGTVFEIAADAEHLSFQPNFAYGNWTMNVNGTATSGVYSINAPAFVVYVYDGTNSLFYVNGQLTAWTTGTPGYSDSGGGRFLANSTTAQQYLGLLQDCFEANVALTPTQIWSLEIGSGL